MVVLSTNLKLFTLAGLLNGGKNNRSNTIGAAKRWPWPLNRGGHCDIEVLGNRECAVEGRWLLRGKQIPVLVMAVIGGRNEVL